MSLPEAPQEQPLTRPLTLEGSRDALKRYVDETAFMTPYPAGEIPPDPDAEVAEEELEDSARAEVWVESEWTREEIPEGAEA